VARFSALFLILLLNGCGDALQEFGGPTMGSHYSLKYVQAEGVPPRERLQAEVEVMLAEVDRQMSSWRADSDLSRFNQLPAGACMAMPESVLQLVRFGARLSAGSEGAFDLTVQPLMELWGFGAQSRGRRVPAAEEIAAVLPVIGQRHLRIDGRRLCKDAAVRLDLDAVGAGRSSCALPWMAWACPPPVTTAITSSQAVSAIRIPSTRARGGRSAMAWPRSAWWMPRRCAPMACRPP
jgi:thiamine biosynthesis lipoprotein